MILGFKILLVTLLIFIVFNLFKAMFSMLSQNPNKPSMSKFIGRRLIFTAALILLLILALATGLVEPNPRPY